MNSHHGHSIHVLVDAKQDPSTGNLKELLKTAVVHYHPDKQPKGDSEAEKKWAVLAEQICKYLSAHYQSFK